MAHYFAPPLKPTPGTQSLRARLQRPARKRKRDDDADDDDADGDDAPAAASAIATLTAAAVAQLRVAGLSPGDRLPPKPFPHAAAAAPEPLGLKPSEVQQRLASLKPPVYVPCSSTTATVSREPRKPAAGLRQHHLGVMTTAMHRCLLKGDYKRAGRAWGMILRGSFNGRPIDVRTHARWGIGAEVLLHRYSRNKTDQAGSSHDPDGGIFTDEGFKAARAYYDRLIVEYPYQKPPHSFTTSAITFYPAMFGLWIHEVSQASSRAIAAVEKSDYSASDNGSESASGNEDDLDEDSSKHQARIGAIRTDELTHARKIAAAIDTQLCNPPYDKHVDLLHLRGMVALWIGDLLQKQAEGTSESQMSIEEEASTNDNSARQKQIAIAKEMFQRSRENGGRLSEGAAQMLGQGGE